MKNYEVRKWDKIYLDILDEIINKGQICENRTGVNTISVPGVSFKLDLDEAFPILESKKVVVKNALSEIMWIYQKQSNDVRWLKERGNPIWNEWMIDEDGIYRIYEPTGDFVEKSVDVVDINDKVIIKDKDNLKAESKIEGKTIKAAKYFGKEYAHTIGTAYGWIVNEYKLLDNILNKVKYTPNDRRMILSLWQDAHLKTAVLPSCVWSSEWKVSDGKLHAYVHQRSCDVPLGLPFNVSQYSILLNIIAKTCGLKPGTLNWSIMDAHIYVNQLDAIKIQKQRLEDMTKIENTINKNGISSIIDKKNKLQLYLENIIKNTNPDNEKINLEIKKIKDQIDLIDFMITKEVPTLEIKDVESIYDLSDDYSKDKEYLKENPTGNKDIVLKKYKSTGFIKMPITQ